LNLDAAIELAVRAHANQFRNNTDIPYIVHPIAVAMDLCRRKYAEELVIAGILHDTVEDSDVTLAEIRDKFGERVAAIVDGCSESDKSVPWEERKQHTLVYLKTAPLDVRIVACADKLHNISTIIHDHKTIGAAVWKRFKRGREQQEWYYRGLVESFYCHHDFQANHSIFEEFKSHVEHFFKVSNHHNLNEDTIRLTSRS